MYEVWRSSDARASEQAMPESLAVSFGACLDQLAEDPWSATRPAGVARTGTVGLGGRGVALVTIHDDTDPPHVLIERIVY